MLAGQPARLVPVGDAVALGRAIAEELARLRPLPAAQRAVSYATAAYDRARRSPARWPSTATCCPLATQPGPRGRGRGLRRLARLMLRAPRTDFWQVGIVPGAGRR
jgi:hypothetical protein